MSSAGYENKKSSTNLRAESFKFKDAFGREHGEGVKVFRFLCACEKKEKKHETRIYINAGWEGLVELSEKLHFLEIFPPSNGASL